MENRRHKYVCQNGDFHKKYHKLIIDVKFRKYLNIAESFNC